MHKFSRVCSVIIVGLVGLILLDVLYLTLLVPEVRDFSWYGGIGAALVCIVLCAVWCLTRRSGEEAGGRQVIWLLVVCFAVKLGVVLLCPVEPVSDYRTFYDFAVDLSQGGQTENRYVALFPHIFGYSWFLSLFFRVLGPSVRLAVVLNVVLTTVSMGLIYYICSVLGGRRMALVASVLWILWPNQSLENALVLSEPLYVTLLLGIWALFLELDRRMEQKWVWLLAVATGLLLVYLGLCRPIAAIPLIILVVWLFVLRGDPLRQWRLLGRKLVCFVLVLAIYGTGTALGSSYIALRLGEEPASTPGYSLCVGFNDTYSGTWNYDDAGLLDSYSYQEGATAQWAQQQMLEEARQRITSGQIDFPSLFQRKLRIFLGNDDLGVWCCGITPDWLYYLIQMLSNGFYLFVLGAMLWGCVLLVRHREAPLLVTVPLYYLGLTMAQMLVEVHSRYHYSLYVPMALVTAYGISKSCRKRPSEPRRRQKD